MDYTNYSTIVYSGGKTASTSLYESFLRNGYKSIHVHSEEEYRLTHKQIANFIPNLSSFIELQRLNKVFIIDSYRTPIERKISSFFENITKYLGKNYMGLDVKILVYYFNKFMLNTLENYHPLDIEFNVFENKEFNFKKKYALNVINNKIYLKLRFKDIAEWPNILTPFLEKTIKISHLINGDSEHPGYKLFKSIYKLPTSYLNVLENDKYLHKYNTPSEVEEYLKMWSEKSENNMNELLNNIVFNRVPDNFDVEQYAIQHPEILNEYKTPIELKIHYELFGYKNYY